MDPTLIPAIAGFALVASITPGPNNIMVMASGANFGFRRTRPHLFGIVLGMVVLLLLAGLGLASLFAAWPALETALKVVAVAYMLWLAWKIATAAPPEDRSATARPLTFLQAAAFQWVNPKAWAMSLTAFALYAPGHDAASIGLIAAIFAVVGLPSVSAWIVLGTVLRRWLAHRARLRAFNLVMAGLLLASLYPALTL